MPRKYSSRGPRCPVCQAVMHAPDGGGEPVCAFKSSHAAIIKARLKSAAKSAETNRKNKR